MEVEVGVDECLDPGWIFESGLEVVEERVWNKTLSSTRQAQQCAQESKKGPKR